MADISLPPHPVAGAASRGLMGEAPGLTHDAQSASASNEAVIGLGE